MLSFGSEFDIPNFLPTIPRIIMVAQMIEMIVDHVGELISLRFGKPHSMGRAIGL